MPFSFAINHYYEPTPVLSALVASLGNDFEARPDKLPFSFGVLKVKKGVLR
jgi:hypothetical protein